MDFAKLPVGFAMALAQNTPALERFGQMSQQQRQAVVSRAKGVRSESEIHRLVAGIVKE